ncbi:Ig-like domain-containing protein [Lutibacter sp.]
MKIINKTIILIALIFSSVISFAQVTVTIEGMTYSNGNSINECGTIDLELNQETTISFWINLSKDSNQVVGDGDLYVYTKYNVNDASKNQEYWEPIPSSYWTNNNTQYSEYTVPAITLQSQVFNTTGGVLFVRYVSSSGSEYNSCNFSIIKDETPTFTISPSSVNISCGSTGETFIVTNENNSPGNLSYEWSVGSGWEYNGNAASNFTTTTNTVILVPTLFPPSNVQVTPKLDGNPVLPQLTATISLASYNPSYTITGEDSLCDTATYAINGLPSGTTIIDWESSDTAIATVSAINNYQAVVTKVSDGSVTITATVQNSCGQTAPFTKNINIGAPSFANVYITGDSVICGSQTKTYSVNIPSHPCIGTINWSVSSNLQIISQNYNTITIAPSTTNLENAGLISVSIPNSSFETTKGILVGLPSHTNGLTIQKIGSYNLYTGQWTKLKANYSVVVYDVNEPFNFTFEWLIPNSQVRNYSDSAYKDVKPYQSGQLNIGVKAINECGCSDWKYRLFDVLPSTTGGGTELIPVD